MDDIHAPRVSLIRELTASLSLPKSVIKSEKEWGLRYVETHNRAVSRLAGLCGWKQCPGGLFAADSDSRRVSADWIARGLAKFCSLPVDETGFIRTTNFTTLSYKHTSPGGWIPEFTLSRGDTVTIDPTDEPVENLGYLISTALGGLRQSWKDTPGKILISEWTFGTHVTVPICIMPAGGGRAIGARVVPEGPYQVSISSPKGHMSITYLAPTGRVREWLALFITHDPHTEIPHL